MRSSKILVSLACLTASTAFFAETAHADRRTGLGGNLLIQDPDDLFPFPQYTLQHRNMIRLDYGASLNGDDNRGNGVLTLGNRKGAYGVALHRGDLLNPDVVGFNTELSWLGGVGNPLGATSASTFAGPALTLPQTGDVPAAPVLPATVVDLFYGRARGADDTIGLRLGFGRGVRVVKSDGETSRGSSTFFVAQFGYSMLPPQGLRLDLSANLLAAFGRAVIAGDEGNKGFDLRLGALARGYYALNDIVDLAFLAALALDNEHTRNPSTDLKSNDFSGNIMAGVGPAIHTGRAQIAAYGGFALGAGKNVPDSDNNDADVSRLNFMAPMVNMAVEIQVLDWLFVRTGAQYVWQLDHFKGTDANGTRKERTSSAPFTWSVGLGVMKNNFYFDGVIRNGFVTNGPNFIGGNANGFLALASMTYKFGDVFDGASLNNNGARPVATPAQERTAPPPIPPAPPAPIEPEPVPEPAVPAASVDANATTNAGNGAASAQGSASGGVSLGR
jgi:hypothetical protein